MYWSIARGRLLISKQGYSYLQDDDSHNDDANDIDYTQRDTNRAQYTGLGSHIVRIRWTVGLWYSQMNRIKGDGPTNILDQRHSPQETLVEVKTTSKAIFWNHRFIQVLKLPHSRREAVERLRLQRRPEIPHYHRVPREPLRLRKVRRLRFLPTRHAADLWQYKPIIR